MELVEMKITFNGHSPTDREVEFTQDDQVRLFEIMKEEFINHITYARFNNIYHPTNIEKGIAKFCDDFGVDVEYEKDRVAFFTSIIKEMKYQ
jgi:hypothetical protein